MGIIKVSKLSKFLIFITTILFVLILSILTLFLQRDNIENSNKRFDTDFSSIKNYTCTEIRNPEFPTGTAKEYRFRLPANRDRDIHIGFYIVHQFVEITIDGKTVVSLKPSDSVPFNNTVGSNWLMLPIFEKDADKEICITIIPAYKNFENRTPEFLMGSELGIYVNCLLNDLPQMILSVIAIFFGLLFIFIVIYSLLNKKDRGSLASLGLFSIMLGIWRLSDSMFTPFIMASKPVFLFYTSVFMMMLSAIFLIRSISIAVHINHFTRSFFDISSIAAIIVFFIQILLDLFNIMDLRQTLFVTHITIVILAIIAAVNLIFNILNFDIKKLPFNLIPFFCIVGPVIDVIMFYANKSSSGLVFSLAGFLLYIVFSGIEILVHYKEQQKLLKEKENQLIENRISIMLSQIQPHFLFNSLGAIRELCKQNPEQAREALDDFSDYLRTNMDSLSKKHLVHFSEELSHTKTYLKLEKLRFGNDLNIIYEIEETDFYLPPLTLQPLVENAVKHGICRMAEGGGTLIIRTSLIDNKVVLSVFDNGVGFDTEALSDNINNRSHIGIDNVRSRLNQLINAELIIKSNPDSGTYAQIILEKRNSDDNIGS